MTKRNRRCLLWIKAVVVAETWGIKRFTLAEIWIAVKSIWSAVWADKSGDASRLLYQRRMRTCFKCPVFDRDRLTCGSPFSTSPELGCWCFAPIKNKMKSARCWARDRTNMKGLGWPSKLMRRSWSR